MKKVIIYVLLPLGLTAVIGLGYCGPVASDPIKDFYRNNTVSLVVTYGPGGGTDAAARIIGANWKAVTGGTMIVKNIVGAGGILGMNQIYNSKPDGLILGYTDNCSSLLGPVIFKSPGILFDATKFVYLGANAINPNGLGIAPHSPESIEDFRKVKGLKFGAHGKDAAAAGSALMIELFGFKDAKIVSGYSGMEEEGLALARGEIDAYTNGMSSMTDHIKKGFVKKVVLVYSYERDPWFPNAPLPTELVKFTPEQEAMYKILISSGMGAKPIFAPPGLSKDKTEFLRLAFNKLFQLETYLSQMKVRFPVITPAFHKTGEEWTKMTKEVLTIPEAEKDKFINLVDKYYK